MLEIPFRKNSQWLLILGFMSVALGSVLRAETFDLRLPTENDALFNGDPEDFFMYVDRTFEGETLKPWKGGDYGYVRTPIRLNGEVVLTKFHEGIDIKPVKRDAAGNPLDLVTSIATGTVAYTSPVAGRSNYGKYCVVAHQWNGSTIYSLYAHLADITVQAGDQVTAGGVLGRMGYTGAGINRTRAHVHLEIGMLMSPHYDDWHRANFGSPNVHGTYNGMNFTGADPAAFYLAHRANPEVDFKEFILSVPVYFKVTFPSSGVPEFAARHPWIVTGPADPSAPSWEISFSSTGLPIGMAASTREVSGPVLTRVLPSPIPHRYLTRGLLTGEKDQAALSRSGMQLVSLVIGDFPKSPVR